MFRPFHPHSPAWAGAGQDDWAAGDRFASERFGRGRPPGRGGGGRGWGDEPRTRRGDIKFILLGLLAERPRHGYELIKALEARHGGFRRLSPGSVYPTLQLLEEGGYLTSELIDGKRVYTLTDSGTQLLNDRAQQADSPTDSSLMAQPPELIELRHTLTELNGAVAQVARGSNAEQITQARELLTQTKREIYRLLAGE